MTRVPFSWGACGPPSQRVRSWRPFPKRSRGPRWRQPAAISRTSSLSSASSGRTVRRTSCSAGFAAHEDAIRAITVDVLDRLAGGETCDLVTDVAQPVVSRVIGSFMGIPPEDDAVWANLMNAALGAGDPDLNPLGLEGVVEKDIP